MRVRVMKAHEADRYTVEKCAVDAKFLFELTATGDDTRETEDTQDPKGTQSTQGVKRVQEGPDSGSTVEKVGRGSVVAAEGGDRGAERCETSGVKEGVSDLEARVAELQALLSSGALVRETRSCGLMALLPPFIIPPLCPLPLPHSLCSLSLPHSLCPLPLSTPLLPSLFLLPSASPYSSPVLLPSFLLFTDQGDSPSAS